MSEYAHPDVLVSTDWVKEHLDDPNVKLVEIDVDTQAYGAGHVPVGHVERFNPVDPDSWMKFVNPKTHTKMHATFTNPGQTSVYFNLLANSLRNLRSLGSITARQ